MAPQHVTKVATAAPYSLEMGPVQSWRESFARLAFVKHNCLVNLFEVRYANQMNRDDLIFRIQRLIRVIEASTELDALNLSAREILKFIGERNAEGVPTRASDVILKTGLGTPPTIYQRLGELEEAGWIKNVPDPEDGRAKLLVLTPRAEKAFQQMSKELARLSGKASLASG